MKYVHELIGAKVPDARSWLNMADAAVLGDGTGDALVHGFQLLSNICNQTSHWLEGGMAGKGADGPEFQDMFVGLFKHLVGRIHPCLGLWDSAASLLQCDPSQAQLAASLFVGCACLVSTIFRHSICGSAQIDEPHFSPASLEEIESACKIVLWGLEVGSSGMGMPDQCLLQVVMAC